MKKYSIGDFIETILILCTIFVMCLIIYTTLTSTTLYTRDHCEVTEINQKEVTVTDLKGDMWTFKGKDFSIGEKVTLIMNDRGSTDKYDDKVIEVIKEVR